MEKTFCISIGSDIAGIPGISARIEEAMSASGFSPDGILDTQLAVEEVIANVISHGYKSGRGEINISCRITRDAAEIEIADTAQPFDPLSLPEPDLAGNVSDRKIGGLGMFLVRQVMDDISYRREGNRNILTLLKKKNP